jgi:ketol-acid reductoisomerase
MRRSQAPKMAYFECLHEVKLAVDLIHEGGNAMMNATKRRRLGHSCATRSIRSASFTLLLEARN